MADTVHKTNKVIAVIALLVSVLALIVGWVAYNRTGENLETQVDQSVQEAINSEAANEAEQAIEEGVNETEEALNEASDGREQ